MRTLAEKVGESAVLAGVQVGFDALCVALLVEPDLCIVAMSVIAKQEHSTGPQCLP